MLPSQYNHIGKKVHHAAIQNGWFETPRTDNDLLLLIQSEGFEMFDAYRNQKHCTVKHFDCVYDKFFIHNELNDLLFESSIKDSFQDEYTDTLMRILDLAAYKQIEFKTIGTIPRNNDFVLDFSAFVRQCSMMLDERVTESNLMVLFNLALNLSSYEQFKKHVDLKIAYNILRGKRHGGKLL